MKTKEWLSSHLENGNVLTDEVLWELLESYIHKSEFGDVDAGDERVVSGDAVYRALGDAALRITETVRGIVETILVEMLPGMLADYVTSAGLAEALADMATKTWVNGQLSAKADSASVNEALEEKADIEDLPDVSDLVTRVALDTLLAGKADASAVYTKGEADALLLDKASTQSVYTRQQIDAVVASRPTQTEVAGEMAAADLSNNAAIASIRTALNLVIARANTLSHVACGSETMQACLMDLDTLQ